MNSSSLHINTTAFNANQTSQLITHHSASRNSYTKFNTKARRFNSTHVLLTIHNSSSSGKEQATPSSGTASLAIRLPYPVHAVPMRHFLLHNPHTL